MRSPLNRTTAPQLIRLFDYCFKQGVIDACNYEDDYHVKEWYEEKLKSGSYGVLNEPDDDFDWRRWEFTLYRWCREGRMGSITDTYVSRIHCFRNSFLFAIAPITMRFYLEGIAEWLEYPNPTNTVYFMNTKKIHWKPMKSYLKTIKTDDFISMVQQFVYERKDKQFEKDLSWRHYDSFSIAVWRLVQKYPVYASSKKKSKDI